MSSREALYLRLVQVLAEFNGKLSTEDLVVSIIEMLAQATVIEELEPDSIVAVFKARVNKLTNVNTMLVRISGDC